MTFKLISKMVLLVVYDLQKLARHVVWLSWDSAGHGHILVGHYLMTDYYLQSCPSPPPRIFIDLLWGGCWYLLEPHITTQQQWHNNKINTINNTYNIPFLVP